MSYFNEKNTPNSIPAGALPQTLLGGTYSAPPDDPSLA